MDQQKVIEALEKTAELVAGLTGNAVVVGAAILAIRGVFSMVLGQSLDAPEYAEAMQRGIERNRAKIGGRIDNLNNA